MCRRLFFSLALCLAVPAAFAERAQEVQNTEESFDQFFSGIVSHFADGMLVVGRTDLDRTSQSKSFSVTPETRVEGKLKPKTRVTVRFVSDDEGDRAIYIIVRPPSAKANARLRTSQSGLRANLTRR